MVRLKVFNWLIHTGGSSKISAHQYKKKTQRIGKICDEKIHLFRNEFFTYNLSIKSKIAQYKASSLQQAPLQLIQFVFVQKIKTLLRANFSYLLFTTVMQKQTATHIRLKFLTYPQKSLPKNNNNSKLVIHAIAGNTFDGAKYIYSSFSFFESFVVFSSNLSTSITLTKPKIELMTFELLHSKKTFRMRAAFQFH